MAMKDTVVSETTKAPLGPPSFSSGYMLFTSAIREQNFAQFP
jgi:hypothetical protein